MFEGEKEYDAEGRPICSRCKELLSQEDITNGYEKCKTCDCEEFDAEFYEDDLEQSLEEIEP